MKYTFHIVDVFSSTPFGGNQLAVLPEAAGISTEGMQNIAREFNFGETTFVLPKNDPANTCRVRIFTPRTELDFAGHPSVGTACALVMKQHVGLSDPIRLILEENVGPVTVDVAQRNGEFRGTLTLSAKIEAPASAPSPAELAAVLSVEPAEVNQVFFAGVGVRFCFAQLNSNEVVDRAAINRAAWASTLSQAWSPHIFFFAGNLQDGGKLYARMWASLHASPSLDEMNAARWSDLNGRPRLGAQMVDCVVCRYWSERLEEARTHGRAEGALKQERRLMVALRTHQFGAYARRFPDLLRDLVMQELELPDKALSSCDPVHARILTDSLCGEVGAVPTYGWQ